jgi:hypothetical protein
MAQTKTMISTTQAPAAIGPYSQAVRVGDMLFTSGQVDHSSLWALLTIRSKGFLYAG